MSSSGVGFSPAFCSNCGSKIEAGVKFCAGCGRPAGAATNPAGGTVPPTLVAAAHGDDIAALERGVAEHPNDESYRKLLAVALHDDAMKDWWEDPEDKELLCVSRQGIDHARAQLTRASQLQFNDPELRGHIEKSLRLVDSMEKRRYVGTWFMVIVLGFFGIFPGVIWWYVNRRLGYLMNRDYMMHAKTGKLTGATAKLGGIQAKIYEFFENLGQFGWLFGFGIVLFLSPIFAILAYKENYLDPKKQTA
jgi:hypothetical protein